MNHAISVEIQFFLISVLWGSLLLLVYDLLRILRRIIKHDDFFIAFEDLLFWVCASLFIFVMMYKENNGIIRGFSIMGMALGTILYHFLISDLFVDLITKLIRMLMSPFLFAIKQVIKIGKLVWDKTKKVINSLIRRLKKWTKSVRISLSVKKQATDTKRQQHLEEKQAKKKRVMDIKLAQKKRAKDIKLAQKKRALDMKSSKKKNSVKKNNEVWQKEQKALTDNLNQATDRRSKQTFERYVDQRKNSK